MAYIKTVGDTMRVWRGLFAKSQELRGRVTVMQLLAATQDMAYTLIVARAFEGVIDAVTSGSANMAGLMAAYVALSLLVVLIWGFGANYLSNRIQDRVQVKFRGAMLQSALTADALDEGDWMKRYSADNKKAAQFLTRAVASQAVSPVLGGVVSLVMLYLIHPILALTALLVGGVLFMLQAKQIHKAQEYASAQADKNGEFSSDMYQIAQNLPVLRMFAALPMMRKRAYAHSAASMEAGEKGARLSIALTTIQSLLQFLGTLVMVLVSCLLARHGALSIGELFAAMAYCETVTLLFNGLAHGVGRVQGGRAAGERVLAALNAVKKCEDKREIDPSIAPNAVEVRNLTVGGSGREILHGVNLTLRRGEILAVMGESGSGKTTLCRALAGDVSFTGSVRLASDRLTYVTGNSRLFEGTLRDNITCFAENADEERLNRAVEAAQLTSFVQKLEGGLNAVLDVHGDNLSGGQRMRIAIARALYQPGDVCLFDEPTAALDERTGAELIRALLRELHGHTVVIVTHDAQIAALLRENGAAVLAL